MTTLQKHPRLLYGTKEWNRLTKKPNITFLKTASDFLSLEAEKFCLSVEIKYNQNTHNEHLLRARAFQVRVLTLLVEWKRTGNNKFRQSVIAHFEEMQKWEYWSWITWRQGDSRPEAIWDLSYGENASTLGIAYDLLYETLTSKEKELFLNITRKWVVPSWLKNTVDNKTSWWCNAPKSNWMSVCACGAGLVAMAMFEELPEAEKILSRADELILAYMNSIAEFNGGWAEGVAYWNYGMRYAFMYLLSYEKAFKNTHPALELPSTLETLRFPPLFSPHSLGCGFGDISDHQWVPVPIHYAVAERLKADDVINALDDLNPTYKNESWPNEAELLLFHSGVICNSTTTIVKNIHTLYDGLGWGAIADQMPQPNFYLSVRGGTSSENHNMDDLLSWHLLFGKEKIISSITNHEYLDTTFSPRRHELSEIRPETKNTIFVGGVSTIYPATTPISKIKINNFIGFHLDATTAISNNSKPELISRLFLVLSYDVMCVIDRVLMKHTNRIETRLHSYLNFEREGDHLYLRGNQMDATIFFASNVSSILATSLTIPTNISEKPANVIRYGTLDLHNDVVMVTVIGKGNSKTTVSINENLLNHYDFNISFLSKSYSFSLTKTLQPFEEK